MIEGMGLLLGDDMVSFSGFMKNFQAVTNQTFARDMTNASNGWRPMDDMPLSFDVTHAASAVVGTKVYLCGGYRGAHPGPHTSMCYSYDHSQPPGTGQQWARFVDIPNNGTAGAGMFYDTAKSTLYYVGGGQRLVPGKPHPIDLNNTWKFDFLQSSNGWVPSTSIPYKANHLSAVTATFHGQERHFIVGGQIGEQEVTGNLAHVFEFIASNETYIQRASMPFGRSHTSISTRAIGCGFVVAGGSANSINGKKNRTGNILYYDIPTNSWTSIGAIPRNIATPLVDIHRNEYMYFINNRGTSRRRIVV
jgi:N-acetylneuraminic acid mutarotase